MIVNRPHHLPSYLDDRIATLDRLLAEQKTAHQEIAASVDEGSSLLCSFVRYGSGDHEAGSDMQELDWMARSLERRLPLEPLRRNLDNIRTYGAGDFLRYAVNVRDHWERLPERWKTSLGHLGTAENGMVEYGYDRDSVAEARGEDPFGRWADDAEFQASRRLLAAARRLHRVIAEGEEVLDEVVERLKALQDYRVAHLCGRTYRPVHESVETLWHATSFAGDILKNGFADRRPDGRRGLGNYGDVRETSFTHDPELARNITHCLREMWLIAHGHLTAGDIAGWLREDGVEEKYGPRELRNIVGLGKDIVEIKTPEETARLYRVYLALSPKREDPVFCYPEEAVALMADRRLEDIAVLECRVRLEADDEYLEGESEFRVPGSRAI